MASPTELPRTVRLQSSDGKTFQVPMEVVQVSRTIATMLRELGYEPQDVIPLPNVHSRVLRKVLGWAEHYIAESTPPPSPPPPPPPSLTTSPSPGLPTIFPPPQPRPQPKVPQRASRVQLPPSHTLSQWDKEFIAKNREDVYDLLLAANYLDIKGLLDILCKAVADMIRGKDPQDIRRAFNASQPSTLSTYPPPFPTSPDSPHPSPPTSQLSPPPSSHSSPPPSPPTQRPGDY